VNNQLIEILKALPEPELDRVLSGLSYRQREMYRLRSGLGDKHQYTTKEVARIFKTSESTVRRQVNKAETILAERSSNILRSLILLEASETLDLYIDPGTASAEEIAELLMEFSALYEMLGGSGITFTIADVKEPVLV
jgi:DNA-binding CsgD family transcriptional regulator